MAILTTTTDLVRDFLSRGSTQASPGGKEIPGKQLQPLVDAADQMADAYLRRTLLKAERTIQLARPVRHQKLITLRAYPIDTSATLKIWQNLQRTFADEDLIEADRYHVDGPAGQIFLDVPLVGGAGTVQLQVTGGLAENHAALLAAAPQLVEGMTAWVGELFRSSAEIGVARRSGRQGGLVYTDKSKPPPYVEAMLRPFRNMNLSPSDG